MISVRTVHLVAPHCAIPRDYLSDTAPGLRAMGFLVSQHGQLGAIPPSPFLSVSPVESIRSGGAIPPPPKVYLSDTGATPYENKENELTELAPQNSVSPEKLTEFGVWNRTLRNRVRPVSES